MGLPVTSSVNQFTKARVNCGYKARVVWRSTDFAEGTFAGATGGEPRVRPVRKLSLARPRGGREGGAGATRPRPQGFSRSLVSGAGSVLGRGAGKSARRMRRRGNLSWSVRDGALAAARKGARARSPDAGCLFSRHSRAAGGLRSGARLPRRQYLGRSAAGLYARDDRGAGARRPRPASGR